MKLSSKFEAMHISFELPQSFLATQNFTSAWRVYCQWLERQDGLGWSNQVQFAGCRINDRNCWEVLISQKLHDQYLKHYGF